MSDSAQTRQVGGTPEAVVSPATRVFEDAGAFVQFLGNVLRQVPFTLRSYPAEIFRHTADIVRSNVLVIGAMMVMLGGLFTMAVSFMFEGLGLESFVGAAPSVIQLRGLAQIVFGWILAAKMGCGIVAELGSMRIGEEIDALEVMGIPSQPYLVVTRVIAGMIVLPSMFVVGLLINFTTSTWFGVNLLNSVSPGGFTTVNYQFQGPREFIIAIVWATVMAFGVTTIACYFGYTAKGGPVGVGTNTAKSMLMNLMFISVSSMFLAQAFYGTNPSAPLGN